MSEGRPDHESTLILLLVIDFNNLLTLSVLFNSLSLRHDVSQECSVYAMQDSGTAGDRQAEASDTTLASLARRAVSLH